MNLWKNFETGLKVIGKAIDKHSPEILIGCGIVGWISTVILVADEAPVVKEKLDELHEELAETDEELSKGQIFVKEAKIVVPGYAPAIVTGVISTGCILGSYKISSKRTAALATAYELTQASFMEYKDKVRETIGENKERKIEAAVAQDKVNENPPEPKWYTTEVAMTDGLSLFYDPIGGRYFRSSVELVRKAEKTISERLVTEMYVPLNDLYFELGLSNTKSGDELGFTIDGGIDIIFNTCMAPDMTPCTVMDFLVGPRIGYDGSSYSKY